MAKGRFRPFKRLLAALEAKLYKMPFLEGGRSEENANFWLDGFTID
jgi:hypothetical protein